MICHKNKLIFIHIPKCGGTSVEKLFGIAPFNPKQANYENLVGWCPERCIYMQHATVSQLLDLNLVAEDVFDQYRKIAIVRNSYDRALSDFNWHNGLIKERGTFLQYLKSKGPYKRNHIDAKGKIGDFSDHIKNQLDFISINGKVVVDEVIEFERIGELLNELKKTYNLDVDIPHEKKGNYSKNTKKYSLLTTRALEKRDKKDIDFFNFKKKR